MDIDSATPSDLNRVLPCLVAAFVHDPITGFLLQTGPGYPERVTKFFSILMRARLALGMPVLVARDEAGVHGAAMGYTTVQPNWPGNLEDEWDGFERATPGMSERIAAYDEIATRGKPSSPHYYLGVLGVEPKSQGLGVGTRLLQAYCERSAGDPLSSGVVLETAKASNVAFYQRAGFMETAKGRIGADTMWCLYLPHGRRG